MGTSTISNKKKSKAAKSALAVVLALALALSGTFAWTAFSQVAPNEMKSSANPGGRLHDDFIWTDGVKNKDVYVENFTDETNGQNIYARVQLKEYLEIGTGAGEYKVPTTVSGLTPYPTGASSTDKSKWQVHVYDKNATSPSHEAATDEFHKHFEFSYGGATKYMPTFNKNKDSLEADVNGSLRDKSGTELNYSNYKDWSLPANATVGGDAYYDNDDNAVDEATTSPGVAPGAGGTTPGNYIVQNETHAAQSTLGATVMTMAEWQAGGSKPGPFWVYDDAATDGGWFYWAQAIKPSTATGKLLDNIELKGAITNEWYYAVDAIGEFVTSEEFRKDADKWYFGGDTTESKTITEDAYNLLKTAADAVKDPITADNTPPAKTYTVSVTAPAPSVTQGSTSAAFTASVTESGSTVTPDSVAWSVSGNAKAGTAINTSTGVLTVADDEPANTTLTVTATATIGSQTATGATTVKVAAKPTLPATLQTVKTASTANADATNAVVTVESKQYVKLAQDGDKVLLMTKDLVETPRYSGNKAWGAFGSSAIWRDSAARTWCNSTYLNSLPADIKNRLVEKDINTKTSNTDNTMISTKDKVFFLTEADVFGQNEGTDTSDSKFYTYGNTSMVPSSLRVANLSGSARYWWLRSPRYYTDRVAIVNDIGDSNSSGCNYNYCARPAFWINLAS